MTRDAELARSGWQGRDHDVARNGCITEAVTARQMKIPL